MGVTDWNKILKDILTFDHSKAQEYTFGWTCFSSKKEGEPFFVKCQKNSRT